MKESDVIIVGGGLVGLMCANLLSTSNLKIGLIERRVPEYCDSPQYDLRTSAISIASRNLFANVGIWDSLQTMRHGYFTTMQVWDSAGYGNIEFNATDIGEPALGWIFENGKIIEQLWRKLETTAVEVMIDQISDISLSSRSATLQLSNETVSSRLIIAADGGESWVRRQLNFSLGKWDYQQRAIVATVASEKPHHHKAMQRFQADGPLAFLPLAEENLSSIVWSTSTQTAKHWVTCSEEEFNQQLYREFDGYLGKISLQGPRASFPLQRIHSDYIQPRVALVGDAAHVIHPLAGQGVNIGFLDAAALAETILAAANQRQDFGEYPILRRYERRRKSHNKIVQSLMDGFYRGFRSKSPLVHFGRNIGLQFVNSFPWLKQQLMKQAIGMSDDIPESCKFKQNWLVS